MTTIFSHVNTYVCQVQLQLSDSQVGINSIPLEKSHLFASAQMIGMSCNYGNNHT